MRSLYFLFSCGLLSFNFQGMMIGKEKVRGFVAYAMMNELFGVVTMTDMYVNWSLWWTDAMSANEATHSYDEGKMFTEYRSDIVRCSKLEILHLFRLFRNYSFAMCESVSVRVHLATVIPVTLPTLCVGPFHSSSDINHMRTSNQNTCTAWILPMADACVS